MHLDTSELRKLAADLEAGSASVEERAPLAVRKVALDIEAAAKAAAPVDTGNLKNSISSDIDGLSAEIGPTAEYGMYVEYGTSRMRPQPYMGPAVDANSGNLDEALGQIAGKIL